MNKIKLTGAALAISAATMFSVAPSVASAHCQYVKCMTVNGCRGYSSCKTVNNACKGQNACRGSGFVVLKSSQCKQILGNQAIYWR